MASPQPDFAPRSSRQPGFTPKLILLCLAAASFVWLFHQAARPLAAAQRPARLGLILTGRSQDAKTLLSAGLALPSPVELAKTPRAACLTSPLGSEQGALTYNARQFGEVDHLGDDLNGIGGENSDLGDPVYAVGDGLVMFAGPASAGWGNVVMLQHRLNDGQLFQSFYGHLDAICVDLQERVHRGQVIGTVGTASGKYLAHLHFEIRDSICPGAGLGYHPLRLDRKNPAEFLQQHRNRAETNLLPALESIVGSAPAATSP